MLTKQKGLPVELHDQIYEKKQNLTIRLISDLKPIPEIVKLF